MFCFVLITEVCRSTCPVPLVNKADEETIRLTYSCAQTTVEEQSYDIMPLVRFTSVLRISLISACAKIDLEVAESFSLINGLVEVRGKYEGSTESPCITWNDPSNRQRTRQSSERTYIIPDTGYNEEDPTEILWVCKSIVREPDQVRGNLVASGNADHK